MYFDDFRCFSVLSGMVSVLFDHDLVISTLISIFVLFQYFLGLNKILLVSCFAYFSVQIWSF